MVVGRPSWRASVRTTASAAILEIEYVGIITRWLSPSGSVSASSSCAPAGWYTPVDEQCRNAVGRRGSAP